MDTLRPALAMAALTLALATAACTTAARTTAARTVAGGTVAGGTVAGGTAAGGHASSAGAPARTSSPVQGSAMQASPAQLMRACNEHSVASGASTGTAPASGSAAHAGAALPATVLPTTVPEYFVEVCDQQPSTAQAGGIDSGGLIVAADTRTGAVLGSVPSPGGTWAASTVYGTADDRTFLVEVTSLTGSFPSTVTLYFLRLSPGTATPVRLSPLPVRLPEAPSAIAISPDATRIAAAFTYQGATTAPAIAPVQAYSTATGAVLRRWTVTGLVQALDWTGDGRGLAFDWNHAAIRLRSIASPADSLIATSTELASLRQTPPTPMGYPARCDASGGWAISSSGTALACAAVGGAVQGPGLAAADGLGTCTNIPPVYLEFLRFPVGQPPTSLPPDKNVYSASSRCVTNADSVSLWWASPDATTVIGHIYYPGLDEAGVFHAGTYYPLLALDPMPHPAGTLAW